ncbi:MAG: prephenate dehydrogenase [Desulfovibrionaceae bacterium]|nr:prephenate dehydrogenase [Desulfovibrionaceae bacterium]
MTKMKKIAIAGASGQMGTLFGRAFSDLGCEVAAVNRPYSVSATAAALAGCDMLLLCIPVTAMESALGQLLPHLPKTAILCDVGSVKVNPIKAMTGAWDGPVVGTHPLFGPVVPEGFTPRVAVMPGRASDAEAADRVAGLFRAGGYACFAATPEEHDRAMALIQGLNFTTTAAYLAAARDMEGIENFVTPSFKRRLDSAAKMFTKDSELFEVISEANPFLQEVSRRFMSYLGLAAGGDLDLLAERAQWWWRDESY